MFQRRAIDDIKAWYRQHNRKPLVIRGARQVGKTTAVRMAARQLGVRLVEINLERNIDLESAFARYKTDELLFNFSLLSGSPIPRGGDCIVFLDEAQATPSAYACLRYFAEDVPQLPVILTGSLLDQVLSDHSRPTPVGRVELCFMGPLTFEEFLAALDDTGSLEAIEMIDARNMHLVPDAVHDKLLSMIRRYLLIGGMPGCIQAAIDTGLSHSEVQKNQIALVQTYKDDFAKYAGMDNALRLNAFFNGILRQVGRQFSHKLANEIAAMSSGDYRQLNAAVERFIEARLFYRVLHSSARRLPLGAETKIRISKFLFVDIGLLLAAQGLPPQAAMNAPLEMAGHGVLAEQFVGQQLLYAQPGHIPPELYYWHPPKREGQAEIDFLLPCAGRVVAVEVKSGTRGTIKSLHSYVLRNKADQAVRISSAKPSSDRLTARLNKIERPFELLSIPFYLVNQIERLLTGMS